MRGLVFGLAAVLAACDPTPQTAEMVGPAEIVTEEGDLALRMANPDADVDEMAERMTASLNPFENDLRNLEVALRLKDEFRTRPNGAEFDFTVLQANGDVPLEEKFMLEETTGVESALIDSQQREGFYIRTYKLADADKPRMAAADAVLKRLKAESTGGNELTFNATALTCVDPEAAAPETYSLTIFVRTHPDVDFVVLADEMLADKASAGSLRVLFQPCDADPESARLRP